MPSTRSTACWSSNARSPSASPDYKRGWGNCARTPEPCNRAARALRRLHDAFAPFGDALPPFTVAVDACADLGADRGKTPRLGAEDRQHLGGLHVRLLEMLGSFTYHSVPTHGDAHLGNTLVTEVGAVWRDLEAACSGPHEWDVACLPASTWPAFDGIDLPLTCYLNGRHGFREVGAEPFEAAAGHTVQAMIMAVRRAELLERNEALRELCLPSPAQTS